MCRRDRPVIADVTAVRLLLLCAMCMVVQGFQPTVWREKLQPVKGAMCRKGAPARHLLHAGSSNTKFDEEIVVEGRKQERPAKARLKTYDDGEWPLLRKLRSCVKDFELIQPGDRILVAVSGGWLVVSVYETENAALSPRCNDPRTCV